MTTAVKFNWFGLQVYVDEAPTQEVISILNAGGTTTAYPCPDRAGSLNVLVMILASG